MTGRVQGSRPELADGALATYIYISTLLSLEKHYIY